MKSGLYFDWDVFEDDNGDRWLDYNKTSPNSMKEMLECFIGRRIGSGVNRTVFECQLNDDFVVKVQTSYGQQNAVEVATWKKMEYERAGKWLAPVLSHSSSNRVIVQRRTTPLVKLPKKLPGFLTDHKAENYGMLDGRVVCHDYGLIQDSYDTKMQNVEWEQ